MSTASRLPQRRGLGRGLGSADPDRAQRSRAPARPLGSPPVGRRRPARRRPGAGRRRLLRRDPGGSDRTQPRPAAAGLRRGGHGDWSTRSARSACCSRSSSGDAATPTTSWSWASAGGVRRRRQAWRPCPRSCGETDDVDMLRDALLRTRTGPSSTRWRRRPTSRCSTTSAAPTRSSPPGSGGRGPRSATLRLPRCHRRFSVGRCGGALGQARPGAAGRRPRGPGTVSRSGSSPRASACVVWRSWLSATSTPLRRG